MNLPGRTPFFHRPAAAGFSLIELLVTIGVIGLLMSASLPALLSGQRDAALKQAGNTLADMTTLARQAAMSRNTITALVVTAKDASVLKQALIVLEYDQISEKWKPLGNWTRLPEAATVVDLGTSVQAAGNTKAKNLAALDIGVDGRVLQSLPDSAYSAILFYPDGRMENDQQATRQLSARFATDSTLAASESLRNYYDVVINSNTSAFRIVRR